MYDVLLQRGLSLLFLAILFIMATGLGRLALGRFNNSFVTFGEQLFFSAGIGFGIVGYSVFILGLLQGLSTGLLGFLLVSLFLLSTAGWLGIKNNFPEWFKQKRLSLLEMAFAALLLLCLAGAFILTLTPEIGKDALIYHLAVPKLFLKHQGFFFIPGNIFSHYPLHSEMLFLVGLFLQGDILAKGIHFLALLFILLGMYQFTRRHMEGNDFPLLSLLVFCSIPSVFVISHTANNDLFVTYYSMAAVFAFVNWFSRENNGWLILSGVFTGLAMASKYTALFLPLLGFLGILLAARHHRISNKRVLLLLFLYGLTTTITGSPFYIKNWIMTGNPTYPFLYSIFGGKGWEPEQAGFYDLFVQNLGMGRTFLDYILLPWNLSFHAKMGSIQFDGLVGPTFILILPFAFMIRKLDKTLIIVTAYCLFTFLFWAFSAQQIRYLIPIFPFLAILTGLILSCCRREKVLLFFVMILLSGSLAWNGYHTIKDFSNIRPVHVIIGKEGREEFLDRMLPSYKMYDYLNHRLPQNSKIFLIYMKNWTFLCENECYSDSMFESYTIQKILSLSQSPDEASSELIKRGFTHILCDVNYIYGPPSTFSPYEKALFARMQREKLQLVTTHGSYVLYRIKDS
ncbi:MAG: glycosyltransferase family 39 protein [Deltaproteobacteria bacterium]